MLQDGLAVTFQPAVGGSADHTLRPHFMLYVPAGEARVRLLPGLFTAEWEGDPSRPARPVYFQAELNGSLKELNGNPVMEATGTGGMTNPTKRIRLNSRSNTLKATFTSPEKGTPSFDCTGRRPTTQRADPPKYLKHAPNENLAKGKALRRGRQLAAEHRCFKCRRRCAGEGHAGAGNGRLRLKGLACVGVSTGWPTGCCTQRS